METLLETAERRDLPRLIERLKYATRHMSGRGQITAPEALVNEALWYAERGDIDEAILRLRLRACPKFSSIGECERRYKAAMTEKRARATA